MATPNQSAYNPLSRIKKSKTTKDINVPKPQYTQAAPNQGGVAVKANPWDSKLSPKPNITKPAPAPGSNTMQGPPPTQQPAIAPQGQTTSPIQKDPLVTVQDPNKQTFNEVDYSSVDNMDEIGLRRYVDQMNARASMGQEISYNDQVLLMEANRRLNDIQIQQVSNPYDARIQAEQEARAIEEARLKAQEEAYMSAEERRLNEIYAIREQQARELGQENLQAGANAMSFSGLGRSTFNAEQQSKIQKETSQYISMLQAEKQTALERERAAQAGATSEALASYDQRISQLRDGAAQYQLQIADQINSFNLQNAASYQDKISNIMAYAQSYVDPNIELTEADYAQAQAYGQLLIDKDGSINKDILDTIDPSLVGPALQYAAQIRGAMPQGDFGFINVGGGMVAITDPTTGEVRYEQGDVRVDPLDQARINQINAEINSVDSNGNPVIPSGSTGSAGLIVKNNPQAVIDFSVNKRGSENLQCGELVNDYLFKITGQDPKGSKRFTDTYTEKIKAAESLGITQGPVEGGIFVSNPLGNNIGHVGIVQSVNADGSINVLEANPEGSRSGGAPKITTITDTTGMVFANAPLPQGEGTKTTDTAVRPERSSFYNRFNSKESKNKLTSSELKAIESVGVSFEEFSKQAQEYKVEQDKKIAPMAQELISLMEEVKGLTPAEYQLMRIGGVGRAKDLRAKFDRVISSTALQQLIDLKSQGATFGALSDNELQFITNSATELSPRGTQKEFDKILTQMIDKLQKGLGSAQPDAPESTTGETNTESDPLGLGF